MKDKAEIAVIESWKKNAKPWIQAIRNGEIESRQRVTNQAIVDTMVSLAPKSILDIGCGEGWLVRALSAYGLDVLGIDVIPEFIETASREGGGRFRELAYDNLSFETLGERFDALVCNFSLFGEESVSSLFQSVPGLLNRGGFFVVQTLHPDHVQQASSGIDEWRDGSWAGFSEAFQNPPPWYFRSLDSWRRLFADSGFELFKSLEPINPGTGIPASIIFVGRLHR